MERDAPKAVQRFDGKSMKVLSGLRERAENRILASSEEYATWREWQVIFKIMNEAVNGETAASCPWSLMTDELMEYLRDNDFDVTRDTDEDNKAVAQITWEHVNVKRRKQ